ncbi:MAG: Asp-tRNA(Asn)/Glu-tRNA(Gln) amidotransferase subunit GatA [Patescibacteria group bacterium]
MSFLENLTIKKFHQGLIGREFSAVEVAKDFFSHIKEKDDKINAYLTFTKDMALETAIAVDAELDAGGNIGILAGTPLAIKDNILIENVVCMAASKILENYKSSYDATVVKRLKKAEAVFLGKTNMDEFAMGSSTENSAFKKTRNPYDIERVPGGSSGGSAAAVAVDMAIGALGSDTGGSIRQPANFCGVVGLKPTYGAVSRFGLIAMASSLDQIGPIAKTVEDAAIIFTEISGRDEFDSTSIDIDYKEDVLNPDFESTKNLKIGLPKEYFIDGIDKYISSAIGEVIQSLKSMGFEFREISLPHTKHALSCYYIIMTAEVSANLARFDGIRYSRLQNLISSASRRMTDEIQNLKNIYFKQRSDGFGEEAKRRIILGNFVLSSGYYDAYYSKAQKVRRLIKQDFNEAFKEVDIILTPVSPTPAFKIGEKIDDPLSMYLSDIFTIPVNLAGLPAISIPVKKTNGLPVGFQLIGKPFREADILGVGRYYEKNVNII